MIPTFWCYFQAPIRPPTSFLDRARTRFGISEGRQTGTGSGRQAGRLCGRRRPGILDRQPVDRNDHRAPAARRCLCGSRHLPARRDGVVGVVGGFLGRRYRGIRRRLTRPTGCNRSSSRTLSANGRRRRSRFTCGRIPRPRPCSDSATTTSVGLAVVLKLRHILGTILSVLSTTLSGSKPSPRKRMELWPVAIAPA